MHVLRSSFVAAAVCLTWSVSAGAQVPAAAHECRIDQTGGELKNAQVYITRAQLGNGDERKTQIRNAIRALTEHPERIPNATGRNFVLAQAIALLVAQPTQPQVTTRGAAGFGGMATQPIDLLAAADSALSAVEHANPECMADAGQVRQSISTRLYQVVPAMVQAGQMDSSVKVLQRILIVDPRSVDAYNALGYIAQQRNNMPEAMANYRKVVEVATADTADQRLRRTALRVLGEMYINQADAAAAAQKPALLRNAVDTYRLYLQSDTTEPSIRVGLAGALAQLGDTAEASRVFSSIIERGGSYSVSQLVGAGVTAFNAGRFPDAARLFEAALAQNPNDLDALRDVVAVYTNMQDVDKLIPAVKRLLVVHPAYRDGLRLLSAGYAQKAQRVTSAAAKSAYVDSAVKANQRYLSLPGSVAFTRFSHEGGHHTLSGTITYALPDTSDAGSGAPRRAPARPAPAAAPRTYTIKFEFLDKAGAVVARQETTVGPVPAGESRPFNITVEQAGIVAFRYLPLP